MYNKGPAFLASYDMAPPPSHHPFSRYQLSLSFSVFQCIRQDYWPDGGGERSQIIRRWESLVLFNPLTTLSPVKTPVNYLYWSNILSLKSYFIYVLFIILYCTICFSSFTYLL
jgi:hypothetical protein